MGAIPQQAPPNTPPGREAGGIGDMPSFEDSQKTMMQQHQRNKSMFKQSGDALKKLDVVRKSLERLQDKQDVVTMDDIVQEAGKLVSHGIDPMALAGILADAPQEGGGEALGGWVAQHAQAAAQGEQALMQHHSDNAHNMAVSALQLMMVHSNAQKRMGGVSPSMGRPVDEGNINQLNNMSSGGNGQLPLPSPGDENRSGSPDDRLAIGSRFMDEQ